MSDGSAHSLRYIPEITAGETPATPEFITLPDSKTTLALTKNTMQSERLRDDRQITDFRHGTKQVGGDVPFEMSYGDYDAFLEAVLCGTWTADTPAVGTDQLKAGTTRRSFTLERYFSDIASADKPYHRFTGVEFNTFNLSVTPDSIITGTFGMVGRGMETDTAIIAGATYPSQTNNQPLDAFTGVLTEGGATIAVITEISLTLENGITPRFVVGSDTSIEPSIARSNCTGQITAYFEDSTLLDKFINETESAINFTLPDPDGNSLKFILPRIKYTGGQPDVSEDGPIMLTMPFQALRDETAETNIIVERTPA